MNVRETLKRSDAIVGLVRDTRKVLKLPDRARRNRTARNYLASPGKKRLQIGAGPTLLDGWLSTDIAPRSEAVVFLDATRPFPFDSDVFDYIEMFYNPKRRHGSAGDVSPVEFERRAGLSGS